MPIYRVLHNGRGRGVGAGAAVTVQLVGVYRHVALRLTCLIEEIRGAVVRRLP